MTNNKRLNIAFDYLLFNKFISTKSDFAVKLSKSKSYISEVLNGSRNISKLFSLHVCTIFPQINPDWILTGEGEMLKTDKPVVMINKEDCGVPVYDIDVTCGFDSRSLRDEEIVGYIDLPYIRKDGRHIVTATGESMMPVVKDGDKVVLKELECWDLLYYGQIYIIVTEDFRMMKYIHKHPSDGEKVVLKSENKHYDDIDLPKELILKLFIVENILSIKTMM